MLAKIIAWGPDRATALERLTAALDQTVVLGVITNLRFLRWLVRQQVVRDGAVRTTTLERIWPPDDWAARTEIPDRAWSLAAMSLMPSADDLSNPWAGGWRLNGDQAVRLEAEGTQHTVQFARDPTGREADDPPVAIAEGGAVAHVDLAGRSVSFRIAQPADVDGAARGALTHGSGAASGTSEVRAPMPGNVLAVHVGAGDEVDVGDPVATIEAMKMEHVVVAPIAGRIAELSVAPSDQVSRGQLLATVEPA
jgi:acetyl-CoA/propionyl-CoA carboxylase biotin carboxyl carrier protein